MKYYFYASDALDSETMELLDRNSGVFEVDEDQSPTEAFVKLYDVICSCYGEKVIIAFTKFQRVE